MTLHSRLYYIYILVISIGLSSCSSLLPREKNITVGKWKTFEEAQQTFSEITPYQTTLDDLLELDINPENNTNITILNYSDIANRFTPSLIVEGFELDDGVRECILAKTQCRGYELSEGTLRSKRYGNFFSDLFNFKRKTDTTGWEFNGIVLIKNEIVIYKLTSGKPSIHQKTETTRPLGPFQSGGIAVDIIKKNY